MRGTRAKKIKQFCKQALEMFPDVMRDIDTNNFYKFAKREWHRDKWKTLKQKLV